MTEQAAAIERCTICGAMADRGRDGRIVQWIAGYPAIAYPKHEHVLP